MTTDLAVDEEMSDTTEALPLSPEDGDNTAPAITDAEDSPEGDTPDADATGQPTTSATDGPASEAAPPASSAPAPEPFVLKAHGKAITLDGVQKIPGVGVNIPEGPALQRAQQLMARGIEMETYGRQKIRELELTTQTLQREQSDAEVHASAIIDWFNAVTADQDTMVDVLTNWAQHKGQFELQVERAKFANEKKRSEWQRKAQEPTPQEQYANLVASAKQTGEQYLKDELAAQHGLAAGDVEKIASRLLRRPELYLIEQQGQPMFDDAAFAADVEAEAALYRQVKQTTTAVEAAAKQNAKVAAGTIPAAVKAPSNAALPPRDKQTGKFTSREEWEAYMRGER
jgi:hypothetical protein